MKFDTLKKPIYLSYLRQAYVFMRLIKDTKNSICDYKKEKELKVHWIHVSFLPLKCKHETDDTKD